MAVATALTLYAARRMIALCDEPELEMRETKRRWCWSVVSGLLLSFLMVAGCKGPNPCGEGRSPGGCVPAIKAAIGAKDDGLAVELSSAACCLFGEPCSGGRIGFACATLASLYLDGRGTTKDLRIARAAFDMACLLKDYHACYRLAELLDGETFSVDMKEKGRLLADACENGKLGAACEALGTQLLGSEDPQAQEYCRRFLDKACKLGEETACEKLALAAASARRRVRRPAWADDVNNLRRFLWEMASACEKSKKETVDLLQQGTLLGYELSGDNKVWSIDTYASGLDAETAQRFWAVMSKDRPHESLDFSAPVNALALDVIATKKIAYDEVLLRAKILMDRADVPSKCREAVLSAADAMLDGCSAGAPTSPWPVAWSASAECGLDEKTPGTAHCGHTSRALESARKLPLWGDYACRSPEVAADRWGECLWRKDYAEEAGYGCVGKDLCCPPARGQASPAQAHPAEAIVQPPAAPTGSCDEGNGAACVALAAREKDAGRSLVYFAKACKLEYGRGCAALAMATDSQDLYKKAARFSRMNCNKGIADECGTVAMLIGIGKARGSTKEALGLAQKGCRLGSELACKAVKSLGGKAIPAAARPQVPKAAPAVARPQVLKAEGVEWAVAPDLAGLLEVVKVSCQRRRTTRPCDVTLRLPRGSGAVGLGAAALHFDRDGVRIGQKALGPYIDGVEPGGAARVRIATLSVDATKVVFTAR